jgi:hypothetical protein
MHTHGMRTFLLLLLTLPGWAQPGLSLAILQPGPRSLSTGFLRLEEEQNIHTVQFTPPLSYRIHNQGSPGWTVTLQSPAPRLGSEELPLWRYQAGTGQLSPIANDSVPTVDQPLYGDLRNGGQTVLQSRAQGDLLYTLGSFQLSPPRWGPAGTYSTTLTVTVSNQP